MHDLDKSQNLLRAIIAGSSSVAAVFITDKAKEWLTHAPGAASWILAAAIVSVGVVAIGAYVDHLVETSARIRRLLTGDDTIEGVWFDFSADLASNQLKHFVIFEIFYEDNVLKVLGSTYNSLGEKIAQWHSLAANYSARKLYYFYESETVYKPDGVERGWAELLFDKPPSSFRGKYHEFSGPIGAQVHGQRVKRKDLAKYRHLRDAESRDRFAGELVTRLVKKHTSADSGPHRLDHA